MSSIRLFFSTHYREGVSIGMVIGHQMVIMWHFFFVVEGSEVFGKILGCFLIGQTLTDDLFVSCL